MISKTTTTASMDDDDMCAEVIAAPALRKFLLVGCERSGTTMLRLMLDHHPQISCMFESNYMVERRDSLRTKPIMQFRNHVEQDWHYQHSGLKFPEDAQSLDEVIHAFFHQHRATSGRPIIGATFHRGFHHLPELFPRARYVHLVRDGRPVAASMIRMGWVGNTYVGAKRWADAIEAILTLQKRVDPQCWLEIRYEQLVKHPQQTLSKLCRFLDVSYAPAMLCYDQDSTYTPPDPTNADRWRQQLSPRDIKLAEMAAGRLLDRLDYPRQFPPARPGRLELAALRLHHRWCRLRFTCKRYGVFLIVARKLSRLLGFSSPKLERRYQTIRDAYIK